jgi:hypothetical protein
VIRGRLIPPEVEGGLDDGHDSIVSRGAD